MKLCTSSWSFAYCSLSEAIAITKALGFNACDLGYFHGPSLSKTEVLENTDAYAEYVKRLEIKVPTFYHLFGSDLYDRNLAEPVNLEPNIKDFKKVIRFCQKADIPVVFIIPGMMNPGQTPQEAFAASARALKEMFRLAKDGGIVLSIEPHVHSFLESPALTLKLLHEVEGLKLTLDYSHFVCMGYRQEEIDPLVPHAAHIHLRQAKPGALQTEMNKGTINMGTLLGVLKSNQYKGYIALEAVHQDYMDTLYEDVLSEIIKMRDFCRRYLGMPESGKAAGIKSFG